MKRCLSILLTAAMLVPFASVPISASAATVETQSVSASYDCIEASSAPSVNIDDKVLKDVRNKIYSHESNFTVSVVVDNLDSNFLRAYSQKLLEQAFEHTGNPIGGDYITHQIDGWSYSSSASGRNGVYNMNINYSLAYYTTKQQEEELDKKVDEILAGLDLDGKSDYEKVCAIYDYMTSHVTYDGTAVKNHDSDNIPFSAYGALCKGSAVCQGYANALYRLLLTEGIDSRIITGEGLNAEHAWNIVKIGNKYYNLDSTWDSQRPEYAFFLCSDKNFKQHTVSDEFKTKQFLSSYPISTESIIRIIRIMGDLDSDKKITAADSLKVLRLSVGLEDVPEDLLQFADVNGDGSVDSSDALDILRYSVGFTSEGSTIGTSSK